MGTSPDSISKQIANLNDSGDSANDVDLVVSIARQFVLWIPATCAAFWSALCV
jgi:hypothetical protein